MTETSTSKQGNHKHGHARKGKCTPTFISWSAMMQRCLDENSSNFERYGGRGIKVCKRWLTFKNFLEDMGERPSKEFSLERKRNEGNYVPSNCRWATAQEQAQNRRSSKMLTHAGKTQCVSAWAAESGVPYYTLCARISRYGWSVERALFTPIRKMRAKQMLTARGKTQDIRTWAEEVNIPKDTLRARIVTYKWPIEKALTTPVKNRARK